jgi:hypothetical protein
MKGVVHPYYTVALAPSIGAVVAIGAHALWTRRAQYSDRLWLAAVVAAAGGWSAVLLSRNAGWHAELRWITIVLTVLAVVLIALPIAWRRRTAAIMAISAIVVGLTGTAAYAVSTASQPHTGSIPSVGPASAGGGMGGGGTGGGTRPTGATGTRPTGTSGGTRPTGTTGTPPTGTTGTGSTGTTGTATTGRAAAGGGATSSSALNALLAKSNARWAAAVIGDQSAADLELASGASVMSIGGWSGTDNSPTLAQFIAYVKAGDISYFISGSGGGGGMGGNSGVGSQITAWVTAHYTAKTVGGTTYYDLTSAAK